LTRSRVRGLIFLGLAALYLLHNDLWLWRDGRILLGLPIGLTYHILFCLAVTALMLLLAWRAWPRDLEVEDDGGERR
jgi:hypothetical protein